ncbi:hypothetical protein [Kingella oralis]|jgi:hypothetical protein|uniref:hypothetical protein n=1 Tax=Kingella oralis TaxID=505 RepID=UPI0034E4F074
MEHRRLADKMAISATLFNTSLGDWATSRRHAILDFRLSLWLSQKGSLKTQNRLAQHQTVSIE